MSNPHERQGSSEHRPTGRHGPVRAPQSVAGGLLLIALAALALWLTRDLDQGTLNAMGPAMLPRWLAIGVGLAGLTLLVAALHEGGRSAGGLEPARPVSSSSARSSPSPHDPALLVRGVCAIPGLGLLVAGPLAIIIGGYATPEARLRDLVLLALSLTPFCMILFGDLLNLPIPVFPQALTEPLPLRLVAEGRSCAPPPRILAGGGRLVFLSTRGRRTTTVDVADHSGRI